MIKDGLKAAVADLIPVEFQLNSGDRIKISIDDALFTKPTVPLEMVGVRSLKVLPTECRQRAATYKADFKVRLTLTINDKVVTVDRSVGCIPIMVRVSFIHQIQQHSFIDVVEATTSMNPIRLTESLAHWHAIFLPMG